MKDKKGMTHQFCRRSNKDSARFAKAFEDLCCRQPKVSVANLIVKIMDPEGGIYSYRNDLEVGVELAALCNKTPPKMVDVVLAFSFPVNMELKGVRTYEQSVSFGKMLKHALKHNPTMTIGQVLAQIGKGAGYCSFHKDDDLIRRIGVI
ncbi:MAG: hypothetical protein ACYC3G_01515 [Minisyncoccota bacterium]